MAANSKLSIPGFKGNIYTDFIHKTIYSTDASAYKETPGIIAIPESNNDIKHLLKYASDTNQSIIPRAAGTSLAGQVVGKGIVVDISKNFKNIIELNTEEKWVKVQPGVVLDELNKYLAQYNLFFGPETSTANRCTIGGMVGNNACGSHSLLYGSTRDHTLEITAFLSDGSEVVFGDITKQQFDDKCKLNTLEGDIYRHLNEVLSDKDLANDILKEYPHPDLRRRNTGYALDLLLRSNIFSNNDEAFNMCKLIAGSEGTLCFITEVKLNLVDIPPKEIGVLCAHFKTKEEAFKANLVALKYNPGAVEMMDNIIIECTKENIEQQSNRYFIEGEPEAILIIEFRRDTQEEITRLANLVKEDMLNEGMGYAFPLIFGKDTNKVWNLRKAGLGLLSNIKGDAKPVSLIEDTAVLPELLPEYMKDFKIVLDKYNLDCVYHAHIGTGELHLRPVLNLKDSRDVELFRTVAIDVAKLVKRYKGSLSGEHGDGRLRGEFIPLMVGEKIYAVLEQLKKSWDKNNLFNPNKIVDTPQMNRNLRYTPGVKTKEIETIFNFSAVGGYMRAVEKCNGSGDCRKTSDIGGTMCPSFMASRNEMNTTRALANVLREVISNSDNINPFNSKEIYKILDLCLSCKGCKSECPSSVDMAKLKAEFLQHYYDANGSSFRSKLIANIVFVNRLASVMPSVANFFMQSNITGPVFMRMFGFNSTRRMPKYSPKTLNRWYKKGSRGNRPDGRTVYFFNDEFTNYNDATIGESAVKLLQELGYRVIFPKHKCSARTYLSKGFVRTAKRIANTNIDLLKDIVTEESPIIGVEPSAILSFRDEYPDLAEERNIDAAEKLAKRSFLIEEFIEHEIKEGRVTRDMFSNGKVDIKLHGHCQQKAITTTASTIFVLSYPENYNVEEINSGCCGMAGSFGYEKEHHELSMKIGELVLFPAVREAGEQTLIAAPGTSCRHQIKDGTGRTALHPAEILYNALKK
jgi:FAD/FMN-containing dehydrogenase/Fe-S oxidoreductase